MSLKSGEYKIVGIDDFKEDLDISRYMDGEKGFALGFPQIDSFFQCHKKEHCILYGSPGSGKTTWLYNVLVNQARRDNKRALIWAAEESSVEAIYKRLLHIHSGKNIKSLSDEEFKTSMEFVRKYFKVLDTSRMGVHWELLEKGFNQAQKEAGNKPFSTMVIDHALMIEMSDVHEKHVRKLMSDFIDFSKANDVFTWIVNHIAKPQDKFDHDSKITYIPPQHPTNLAGGQMWFRLAYNMIEIFRPDFKVYKDATDSETWVNIRKVKNPEIGKTSYVGQIKLEFDVNSQSYGSYTGLNNESINPF